MKSFLLIFSILFSITLRASDVSYDSVLLKSMPYDLQFETQEIFKMNNMNRALIGVRGSEVLGFNMLFTDEYFVGRVALKYNVTGDFKLDELYEFSGNRVLHFKDKNGVISALIFKNVEVSLMRRIASQLAAVKTSSHTVNIIPKAYADVCSASLMENFNLDTTIADNSASAMISKCFNSIGEGVEDSTIGMVKGIWISISSEYSKFMDNPKQRLSDYYGYASKGLDAVWDFSKAVGKMLVDPVYGKQILNEKFGEIGAFFVNAYNSMAALPLEEKVDLICNLIGAIGVDVLITAVTVGAGGAKLAATITRMLNKLLTISKIAGKGLKYPFKVLEKLADETIRKLEKIVDSGNQSILNRKLKGVGCAL